jgi:hypothetical protein
MEVEPVELHHVLLFYLLIIGVLPSDIAAVATQELHYQRGTRPKIRN